MRFLLLLIALNSIDYSIQQPPLGTTTTTTVSNYNYPSSAVSAASDPMITSWVKSTGYSSSWKAYTNVNKVQYSSQYVYVSASGIPSYSVGPFPGNPGNASNQNWVIQYPRVPVANTGTKTTVSLNSNGLLLNGVPFFNAMDGQNIMGWNRNAFYYEITSFDSCMGHPQNTGVYHNHAFPACLSSASYTGKHSPLLGYVFDGYPIYGPWGYTNATDATSAVKRIQSSYSLRSITSRTTLVNGTTLAGPTINSTYPLGCLLDDFQYVAGAGDLDASNGRWCVTPEYPSGTYAYFMTTDSSGNASYPYILGLTYYGNVVSNDISSGQIAVTESVTTYYTAVSPTMIQSSSLILFSSFVYLFIYI